MGTTLLPRSPAQAGGDRSPAMVLDYRDELRFWPTTPSKVGTAVLVVAWLVIPLNTSDYWLNILAYAGISAIGALGLNLLTGYTGQVSLGHGFFVAVGSYTCAYLGAEVGWPLSVWLPAATALGFLLGAIVGPFALRLRGNYLVIVTFALLFVGRYAFDNLEQFTGGGTGIDATKSIPTLASSTFDVGGLTFSRDQGFFWLIWSFVGLCVVAVRNIVRTRPGRAMRAIRERDLAAAVIGVSPARYKVAAFAWSSALAALAGALYGSLQGFVNWIDPPTAMLLLSIQYVAIVILGGIGTVYGPILGAVLLGSLQPLIQSQALRRDLPLVRDDAGGAGGLFEMASLINVLYGATIIIFLVLEPHGLAGLCRKANQFVALWPLSR